MATTERFVIQTTFYDLIASLQKQTDHLRPEVSDEVTIACLVEMMEEGRLTLEGNTLLPC